MNPRIATLWVAAHALRRALTLYLVWTLGIAMTVLRYEALERGLDPTAVLQHLRYWDYWTVLPVCPIAVLWLIADPVARRAHEAGTE